MKALRHYALLTVAMLLAACAAMQTLDAEQRFQMGLESGYRTASASLQLVTVLTDGRVISAATADSSIEKIDELKQSLDVVRALHLTDPQAAQSKLEITIAALAALEQALRDKQNKESRP